MAAILDFEENGFLASMVTVLAPRADIIVRFALRATVSKIEAASWSAMAAILDFEENVFLLSIGTVLLGQNNRCLLYCDHAFGEPNNLVKVTISRCHCTL